MSRDTLLIGDLEFEIRRSSRRATVGITVERDGTLLVHAPETIDQPLLIDLVERKTEWVYTKLAQKELMLLDARNPEYVPGESFNYLGRSYRLRLVDRPDADDLRLAGEWFELRRDQRDAHRVSSRTGTRCMLVRGWSTGPRGTAHGSESM